MSALDVLLWTAAVGGVAIVTLWVSVLVAAFVMAVRDRF